MSCNIMFDEDNKSDVGNHLCGSCWSEGSSQLDERNCLIGAEKVANSVVAIGDGLHKHNVYNCANIYECHDCYNDGQPYQFSEICNNSPSHVYEDRCRNDNSVTKESHVKRNQDECNEWKEGSENSEPVVYNSEELHNSDTVQCLFESNHLLGDEHHACNESRMDSQADDNLSYRSIYTTDLTDDDSLPYYNSDAENNADEDDDDDDDEDDDEEEGDDDTRSLYIIECNSEEFLETRPSAGFATIIRAFSVWAEMEQFEKPPPPAAKEVVQNLENKMITEKGYQCPVCLGICDVGETLKLLPCTHAFHNECILPWLEKTNTCPLCRHEMPTDNEDYELFKKIETGRQLRN